MSNCDLVVLEARIDRLEDQNEALAERNDHLEAKNDHLERELAEYREQNERDKAQIRQDVHETIEVRTDDNDEDEDPTLADIWIAGQPLGKIIDSIRAKIDQQPESVQSDESSAESGRMGTPMEQLIRAGEAGVIGHVTARDERAMEIAEHFAQWASKAPNGLVIRDGLKKLLSTATGENLAWSQINRACDALQEATKGAIARKKTKKHGWILVAQPDDHRLRSLLAATS